MIDSTPKIPQQAVGPLLASVYDNLIMTEKRIREMNLIAVATKETLATLHPYLAGFGLNPRQTQVPIAAAPRQIP